MQRAENQPNTVGLTIQNLQLRESILGDHWREKKKSPKQPRKHFSRSLQQGGTLGEQKVPPKEKPVTVHLTRPEGTNNRLQLCSPLRALKCFGSVSSFIMLICGCVWTLSRAAINLSHSGFYISFSSTWKNLDRSYTAPVQQSIFEIVDQFRKNLQAAKLF